MRVVGILRGRRSGFRFCIGGAANLPNGTLLVGEDPKNRSEPRDFEHLLDVLREIADDDFAFRGLEALGRYHEYPQSDTTDVVESGEIQHHEPLAGLDELEQSILDASRALGVEPTLKCEYENVA